jgi:hypothetical protein
MIDPLYRIVPIDPEVVARSQARWAQCHVYEPSYSECLALLTRSIERRRAELNGLDKP